jgi:hypothetical protein
MPVLSSFAEIGASTYSTNNSVQIGLRAAGFQRIVDRSGTSRISRAQ